MIATFMIAALISGPTVYRVDPAKAEAGFELKATMHTVHGATSQVSGEIHAAPGAGDAIDLSGTIAVDVASLVTGNDKRDAKMHGESLDVAAHPSITLEAQRFVPEGPQAADGSVTGVVVGQLTIRGHKKPLRARTQLSPHDGRMTASGSFDVDWAEFDVPDPSFFVVHIAPVASAHFRVELVPVP